MKFSALALCAFTLAGCRGVFEFPPQAQAPASTVIVQQPDTPTPQVVQGGANVTEVIEPDSCFVRARHFSGYVQKDCAAVARETRP